MKNRAVQIALTFGVALLAVPALAQSTELNISESTPVSIATIYIQTKSGVVVFTEASNGKLTEVKGSPFPVSGQMEDIGGNFLISVGTTILHVYQIESNGAVGKQISEINTASYGGSKCGGTGGQGSVLNHAGKYLYVQLNSLTNNACAAWQTYRLESDGYLQFVGDMEYYQSFDGSLYAASAVPTISSSDKFGYSSFVNYGNCPGDGQPCPAFSAFVSNAEGVFEINSKFSTTGPEPPPGNTWYPYAGPFERADGNGHIAALLTPVDSGNGFGRIQLASYTINPTTGALSSSNSYEKMPFLEIGDWDQCACYGSILAMSMSPSGDVVAVGGEGLQLFHFNGAATPTSFGGTLGAGEQFQQLEWDNNKHLFALSYGAGQIFQYTVTSTSITQAPGSPYQVPATPDGVYGVKGMVIVPK